MNRRQNKLMRSVDIIGAGISDLGMVTETPSMNGLSIRELWTWAAAEALSDAGISASEVDALFVGNMLGEYVEGQYHLGYVLDLWTGLSIGEDAWKPSVRIEGACASASHAIRQAVFAVASGAYDVVIAGGVGLSNAMWSWETPGQSRRLTNVERVRALYGHYDQGWEIRNMLMLDHTLAQWLIGYMQHYGLSRGEMNEMLNARLIANYGNGMLNPRAYRSEDMEALAKEKGFDGTEAFLNDPVQNRNTCWPMRRWDEPRRCDGAGALIICSNEVSRCAGRKPIHYLGTGNAHQTSALSRQMYTQPFIRAACEEAYSMAGIGPPEVDVVEMYDYGPAEYIIPLEDAGFFGRGEAHDILTSGEARFCGARPVNPSGGSSCGTVAGAIGAISIWHLIRQLRGEAGPNQAVLKHGIGMSYDCGGGRDAVIHLLGR